MLYLLKVKESVKNLANVPLRNELGNIQKELVRKSENVQHEIALCDPHGNPFKKTDGSPLTQTVIVPQITFEEQIIIPTRIQSKEYLAYQEIGDQGDLLNYYNEKGDKIDLSDANQEITHEVSIIDKNPAIPKWYKNGL